MTLAYRSFLLVLCKTRNYWHKIKFCGSHSCAKYHWNVLWLGFFDQFFCSIIYGVCTILLYVHIYFRCFIFITLPASFAAAVTFIFAIFDLLWAPCMVMWRVRVLCKRNLQEKMCFHVENIIQRVVGGWAKGVSGSGRQVYGLFSEYFKYRPLFPPSGIDCFLAAVLGLYTFLCGGHPVTFFTLL